MIRYGTPIEVYDGIGVKRDDLVIDPPAPRLGKIRGIARQIYRAVASGERIIGAVDRSPLSRNIWAHAYLASQLGLPCVGYAPEIGANQERAYDFGGIVKVLLSNQSSEVFYKNAEDNFRVMYEGYMAPDDCFAPDIIESAFEETLYTGKNALSRFTSIVVPTSSGGLALGIRRALRVLGLNPRILIHRGGSRRSKEFLEKVLKGCNFEVLEDTVYPNRVPEFPLNPTYEQKAWNWAVQQSGKVRSTVLFWNAGAD